MSDRTPPIWHEADAPAEAPMPRFASRGRAFVYVAPSRDDTVFKIGFSRDPFERLRSLHGRFFEFFDLDRGLLVATDSVRDARRLERRLLVALKDFQALEPPVVSSAAAGRSEWFRGVLADAEAIVRDFEAREGFTIHRPASAWFRATLSARQDLLFAWTARMLDAIEFHTHNAPDATGARTCARVLRDTLDLFDAFAIDPSPRVPQAVLRWYRG